MKANVIEAENAAVQRLEAMLEASGWSDGWALTDDEVRASTQEPLFYRNSTPTVAPEVKVQAGGQSHSLYLVYNVVGSDPNYSGNKPMCHGVTLALTFYYDDPFLFYQVAGEPGSNPFTPYIKELMDEIAEDYWTISSEGEDPSASTEDGSAYINRKILFINKLF